MRTLIVTAVEAEAVAIQAGISGDADVHVIGVGLAAAAAGTASLLARGEYGLVISAGIAGGFPGRVDIGEVVVGTCAIAPELGAASPGGFIPIDDLGFGTATLPAAPLAYGARKGHILTVQTVTGTTEGTVKLMRRYPEAIAEAMEGFGAATAAVRAGVPFAELRAISNLVGPRDTSTWRIKEALAALTKIFQSVHG
jgi:futalosine hydrolase